MEAPAVPQPASETAAPSEAPVAREETAAPTASIVGGGPALYEHVPGTPEALRESYEAAVKIEVPSARETTIADIAWNAVEIDPQLAGEAFQHLSADSPEKIRLIQHYAMRLAEQDPDQALAWAGTADSDQEFSIACAQVALVLAESDPRRAANLLSELGVGGRDLDVAVVQVVQRWAAQSPPDAAAWVTLFPPGAAREAGLKIITGQWLPRNAPAAFNWLNTLKDGELRKETLRAMEGVILQQPQATRDGWLRHADARTLGELKEQREQAIKEIGGDLQAITN